jgi:hypothetical protein
MNFFNEGPTLRKMDMRFSTWNVSMFEQGRIPNSSFLLHKRIMSAVRGFEFVSDRMLYTILWGCWCDVIVLNVHALTGDKIDYVKDSYYEELERV